MDPQACKVYVLYPCPSFCYPMSSAFVQDTVEHFVPVSIPCVLVHVSLPGVSSPFPVLLLLGYPFASSFPIVFPSYKYDFVSSQAKDLTAYPSWG